jgi:Zn-dependent protease with chaperone function/tellurite resistance protein
MNFFEAQDHARTRTRVLVALFTIAVLAIVSALFVLISSGLQLFGSPAAYSAETFFWVLFGTTLVVGGGSVYRTASLRAGGPVVAGLLGGRPVLPESQDDGERRLRNVVEEMALAAGVPIPHVYVLPYEASINAFAAGWTVHDAAIAVTRGALDHLTRDELQGVVAHEFSHILNGDMRLNIRLIGLVFGLLQLAVLGQGVLRSSRRGWRHRDSRTDFAISVGGIGLVLLGYIGVLFGNLIRAAVSRQREFLADAAAAQFTRNPASLADALRKIGGLPHRSFIQDYHAEELRHVFFAEGVRSHFFHVFATHPPLEARIRRLHPRWDGTYEVLRPIPVAARPRATVPELLGRLPEPAAAVVLAHLAEQLERRPERAPVPLELRRAARANVQAVLASVGSPTAAHIEHAARSLAALPDAVRAAARQPEGAQALLYALLIHGTAKQATAGQRELVARDCGAAAAARTDELTQAFAALADPPRLLLLDLALPALRALPEAHARTFLATARRLISADGEVRAFEYAAMHILGRQLGAQGRRPSAGATIHSLVPVRAELSVLLSALAWTGADGEAAARTAFFAGVQRLPASLSGLELLPRDTSDLPRLDAALQVLERTALGVRRRLLDACAYAAAGDGFVDAEEAELLRAVAECLETPIPPLLATLAPVPAG